MDVAIVVDNLISNAKRAEASRVSFEIFGREDKAVLIKVNDNGRGLARGADADSIFDMGYTTTTGSGLGLYHVRQVLGGMNGSIEFDKDYEGRGVNFNITIAPIRRRQ